MFRDQATGRPRQAIGVELRAPGAAYGTTLPEIVVVPGTDARLVVRVANRSAATEQLELTVEGMPADWADIFPRSVRVPAGEQRETDVIVRVPHSAEIKAAEWPLRVVAFAGGRRVGSAPARVCIAPHPVVCVELRPEALRARRRAHAQVLVRNEGNAGADVELSARVDATDALPVGCALSPPRVSVGPGEEVVARLEVTGPRRWLRRGEPMSVRVDANEAHAEAKFQQRAALPAWLVLVPMLAAAAFVYLSGRPNQVPVPEVTGLTVPEAREKLREAGLEPRQAPLAVAAAATGEAAGVIRQDPPAGTEIADGDAVTISYYRGEGVGTITPDEAAASVAAPADGSQEPLAYARANRVLVLFPGNVETAVGGTVGELSAEPAWDPRTGELAYVRRASPTSDAQVVAVDPHTPGTPRALTRGDRSYVSPTFSPDGSRLAVVAESSPGAGGSLCVVVPPATAPRCHLDGAFLFYAPAWSTAGLYALRRKVGTTGQDELMRVGADLLPQGSPLATGDLRALAVAADGRLAVLNGSRIEIHAPAGELLAAQTVDGDYCDLAWSGDEVIASHGACGASEQLERFSVTDLDAPGVPMFDGADPAVAG